MSLPKSEFNLLHEPWIRVLDLDGGETEASLCTFFENAPSYSDFAGELPTQDIAVMRLLLAILHVVFAKCDVDGTKSPVESVEGALDRWRSLWELGEFPHEVITDYLKSYEDRFYLFDDKRPFYQVPEANIGTPYGADKLNGELSQSNNKIRLFPTRTGATQTELGYGEAARWLLYVNGFDDTSAKAKINKGSPSPGAGWLGKLGLITAVGNNLFETLMLNLTLLKNGTEIWGEQSPVWELETPRTSERTEIICPDNLSQLLTLQSRRLLLSRKDGRVTGFTLMGGDFFDKAASDSEQMTLWRLQGKATDVPKVFIPRRLDPSKRLWRDFSAMFIKSDEVRQPGIVLWLSRLKETGMLDRRQLRFQASSVQYGDKDFFVADVFGDSLSLHANLLTSMGKGWIVRIEGEVAYTTKIADYVGMLAQDLAKAESALSENSKASRDRLREISSHAKYQFYYRVDVPFRQWLEDIDPTGDTDNKDAICARWRKTVRGIAFKLGHEMVTEVGLQAFKGRHIKDGKEGRKKGGADSKGCLYTAPKAFNRFTNNIGEVYNIYHLNIGGDQMADCGALSSAFVEMQIAQLCSGNRRVPGILAKLRRGIGRPPGDRPELWDITLRDMPEELLSKDGAPTKGEWATYTALTLFALHQQGRDPVKEPMNQKGMTLGIACRCLVDPKNGNEDRIKSRFDAVATSANIAELANHLRGIVTLLRAAGVGLDYPSLAKDLFWYQYPEYAPSVRLRWGQDFYKEREGTNNEGK